jgi:hypothetical protein
MLRSRNKGLLASLWATAALAVPASAYAGNFCVAVNGGFGGGGTTYVGPGFTLPAKNQCAPWAGFTKTACTVIAQATGSGCVSNSGKVLTLTIFNTDPDFFGDGKFASDHIELCPTGVMGCPFTSQDHGYFEGLAEETTCTAALLLLPQSHD